MNINNIGVEVAAQESVPVDAPAARAVPTNLKLSAETDKVKNLKPAADQKGSERSALSPEETKEIAADLNEYMSGFQTNLSFSISEELNHQVIVEIKNKETNELIKQIPSEDILVLREKMEELTGLIFDGRY